MPSPIGHAIAGFTVHLLTARDRTEQRDRARALTGIAAATAPDLDLLLKLVDGRNHHQGATHSLVAAVAAAMLIAAVCAWRGAARPLGGWGALVGIAWGSHLLLDYLARDTSPPIGLPLLWPARDRFHYPHPIFFDIGRTLDWATVSHDAVAMAWEVAVLLPILALTLRWRSRRAA